MFSSSSLSLYASIPVFLGGVSRRLLSCHRGLASNQIPSWGFHDIIWLFQSPMWSPGVTMQYFQSGTPDESGRLVFRTCSPSVDIGSSSLCCFDLAAFEGPDFSSGEEPLLIYQVMCCILRIGFGCFPRPNSKSSPYNPLSIERPQALVCQALLLQPRAMAA